MRSTSTLRVPSGLVAWALLATVLTLALTSTGVLYLSNQAGRSADSASRAAESYRKLEVVLLQAEVARHDLFLEGGSATDVMYRLSRLEQRWHVIEGSDDVRHAEEVRALGHKLAVYQSAVTEVIKGLRLERPVPDGEARTDAAAANVLEHAQGQTATHDDEAALALGRMRELQQGAARTFPVVGLLSLALVGACIRLLTVQRRRLASLREDAHHRSVTDELTGLANRAGLRAALEHSLARRSTRRSLAVMLLDLNDFKAVNDTYGHELGDEVLKAVASRLHETAPAHAIVGRLGGDEFVVLVPETDRRAAQEAASALHAALSAPAVVKGVSTDTSASIGVALSDDTAGTSQAKASDLLRRADIAMYSSKTTKGGPVLWSDNLDQFVARVPQRQKAAPEGWRAVDDGAPGAALHLA